MTDAVVLSTGQYQIGGITFGRGTTVPVEKFDIKSYDINNQDFQVGHADEMRFGEDQFKPTVIQITFDVLYNKLLPPYEGSIANFWEDKPKVSDFQYAWRFDKGRKIASEMDELYFCGLDGITKIIFGRPRRFTHVKTSRYTEAIQCIGEFQRADTLVHRAQEYSSPIGDVTIHRDPATEGDADAWFRVVAVGPVTNPTLTVGDNTIHINGNVPSGQVLEISTYPWDRAIYNVTTLENLSAQITGGSNYLDRMTIPSGVDVPVSWSGGGSAAIAFRDAWSTIE